MGIDDRDDEYRSRGQAPRRRGSYESSEPPASRSYQRGGRPRGYDEQSPSRSPSRRDDDPRSGSRYERGAPDRSGADRRPRPDQSPSGRRSRSEWDDDPTMRRERRGADPYTRGERTARNPRPPMRDEWETSARPRGGPRNPSPADSGGRGRRPGAAVAQARGGLWGDEAPLNGSGARRGMMDARDPRAARRGQAQVEEEESSRGGGFGKALLAIVLALVLGAGAAYGYYIYSTPKIPASISHPPGAGATGATGAPYAGHAIHAAFAQPPNTQGSAQRPIAFVTLSGARQA